MRSNIGITLGTTLHLDGRQAAAVAIAALLVIAYALHLLSKVVSSAFRLLREVVFSRHDEPAERVVAILAGLDGRPRRRNRRAKHRRRE